MAVATFVLTVWPLYAMLLIQLHTFLSCALTKGCCSPKDGEAVEKRQTQTLLWGDQNYRRLPP